MMTVVFGLRYSGLLVIKNALQFIPSISTYFRMSHLKHVLGLLWKLIHHAYGRQEIFKFHTNIAKNLQMSLLEIAVRDNIDGN